MKEFNMTGLREALEQLSTEELDAMLQAELEREEPDPAAVRLLMDILKKREAPTEPTPGKDAAWQRYQQRVEDLRKRTTLHRNRILKAAASIVLVFGLLFVTVPQTAEADSLWDVLVRWSSNALEVFSPIEIIPDYQVDFVTDNPGLQQIYDTAVEKGIDQPLVPMWFPEGYVLETCETANTPRATYIVGTFSSSNAEAVLQIVFSDKEDLHGYFGEEDNLQKFEREGTQYKTMRNNNRWTAVWTIDNIEYFLTIDCQEDTLQRILDSIYVLEE